MGGLRETVSRLAGGSQGRTEADIQADVRAFLLEASLELDGDDVVTVGLETQAGGGRRIDVEAGCAIFEVKKDLGSPRVFSAAAAQLAGYVAQRSEAHAIRFVGVLTDGRLWVLFHVEPSGRLSEVSRFDLEGPREGSALAAWLETFLATTERIAPTPRTIVDRLGAGSPATALDLADLHALYRSCRDEPEVQVKRELWARLLKSALGTGFDDSDDLFVAHTYLVLVAELVAHEVMGLPTSNAKTDVRALLEGQQFAMAGLHGVVEADFFDWPATAPQGSLIVSAIARRLSTFDWSNVEHDVLKALYESVIDAETRHRLGEYYTPDWLAEKIVMERFSDPLQQRLLDPACGSGTFLFWAIRQLLVACDREGLSNREALARAVDQVYGMDLHPVAVTLARVTYLLALTPERLANRDELTVPVFLGDSVRWEQEDTMLTDDGVTIRTANPLELFEDAFHFPEGVVEEPERFDRLVAALAARAADRQPGGRPPSIVGLLNRYKVVGDNDREGMTTVFKKLCRLHDSGRDHVWSYYIRNLMRPLSFARPDKRADVLVGNPPWLAYRAMPKTLQAAYRELAKERGLWVGGAVATHQDLSDLFVARAIEQYLKEGGSFAFVMPFAVLSRRQFAGFRAGEWGHGDAAVRAHFVQPEEFARVKPPPFAVPCSVISGTKATTAGQMPSEVRVWQGRLPSRHLDWAHASEHLDSADGKVDAASGPSASPYRSWFRQGATMVPRMLVTVVRDSDGPLGVAAGLKRVCSARSANEKQPWKGLSSLNGVVEREFVRPMHLGATIVAFRARTPSLAIVPTVDDRLVDGEDDLIDEFPGLAEWWRHAESCWESHKTEATRLSLRDQVDYHGKLSKQFPIREHRIVYTKSGQHLAACRVDDPEAVIDHTLYWAPVRSIDEGRYLCAILNSGVLSDLVTGLQARGQHNPRHFDMNVFALPFPLFDDSDATHTRLAELGARAEEVAGAVELDDDWQFQKARRVTREALDGDGVAGEIDGEVAALPELVRHDGAASVATSTPDLISALEDTQQSATRSGATKRRHGRVSSAKADAARRGSRES